MQSNELDGNSLNAGKASPSDSSKKNKKYIKSPSEVATIPSKPRRQRPSPPSSSSKPLPPSAASVLSSSESENEKDDSSGTKIPYTQRKRNKQLKSFSTKADELEDDRDLLMTTKSEYDMALKELFEDQENINEEIILAKRENLAEKILNDTDSSSALERSLKGTIAFLRSFQPIVTSDKLCAAIAVAFAKHIKVPSIVRCCCEIVIIMSQQLSNKEKFIQLGICKALTQACIDNVENTLLIRIASSAAVALLFGADNYTARVKFSSPGSCEAFLKALDRHHTDSIIAEKVCIVLMLLIGDRDGSGVCSGCGNPSCPSSREHSDLIINRCISANICNIISQVMGRNLSQDVVIELLCRLITVLAMDSSERCVLLGAANVCGWCKYALLRHISNPSIVRSIMLTLIELSYSPANQYQFISDSVAQVVIEQVFPRYMSRDAGILVIASQFLTMARDFEYLMSSTHYFAVIEELLLKYPNDLPLMRETMNSFVAISGAAEFDMLFSHINLLIAVVKVFLLHIKDVAIVTSFCVGVRCLGSDRSGLLMEALGAAGVCSGLIQVMREAPNNEEECRGVACAVVRELTKRSAPNCHRLAAEGGILELLRLATADKTPNVIVIAAVGALDNLCRHSDLAEEMANKFDVPQFMMRLLEKRRATLPRVAMLKIRSILETLCRIQLPGVDFRSPEISKRILASSLDAPNVTSK